MDEALLWSVPVSTLGADVLEIKAAGCLGWGRGLRSGPDGATTGIVDVNAGRAASAVVDGDAAGFAEAGLVRAIAFGGAASKNDGFAFRTGTSCVGVANALPPFVPPVDSCLVINLGDGATGCDGDDPGRL